MRRAALSVAMVAAIFLPGAPDAAAADKEKSVIWTNTSVPHRPPRPPQQTPFPAIKDWNSLRITLSRGGCFGTCPNYSVEIHGNGVVLFEGREFVAAPGKHRGTISPNAMRVLHDAFRKAQFFWLFDEYSAPVSDNPTYELVISFDGRRKAVSDYAGLAVGMPKETHALEERTDVVAGTEKWVHGNGETLAALKAEGWNFRRPERRNLRLLRFAADNENAALVAQLLAEGWDVRNEAGASAVLCAIRSHDIELLRNLLARNAPVRGSKVPYRKESLDEAAEQAVPEILKLILGRDPNVNRRDENGDTPFLIAAGAVTRGKGQDFDTSLRLLIAAGADPNAQDDDGNGAFAKASIHEGMIPILVRLGVSGINAPNKRGRTPLMQASSPDVIKTLLRYGADPYQKDKIGRTALDIKRWEHEHWPHTMPAENADILAAWMAAHPK